MVSKTNNNQTKQNKTKQNKIRWKDRSGVRLSKMEIGWPEAKAMESVLINTSQDNKNIKDSELIQDFRMFL